MSTTELSSTASGHLAELARIVGLMRTVSGAISAKLVIADEGHRAEIRESGEIAHGVLCPCLANFAKNPDEGPVVFDRLGEAPHGDRVLVPLRSAKGVPIGALVACVEDRGSISADIAEQLVSLGALATFVLCGWVASSEQAGEPDALRMGELTLFEMDADLNYTHVSSLTGVSSDWMVGRSGADVIASYLPPDRMKAHLDLLAARKPFQDLTFDMLVGERTRSYTSSGYPVFDSNDAFLGYRGVVCELSSNTTPAGVKASRFDATTGLLNRHGWYAMLSRMLPGDQAYTSPSALLLLDIDHFKSINHKFGHAQADEVLHLVGRRLEEAVRVRDRVARIGPDEFAIIASDIQHHSDLNEFSERLEEAFLLPVSVGQQDVTLSFTTGMAIAPAHGASADELIANAGLALARAKDESRGKARLYSADMRQQLHRRVVLDNDLQQAVAAHEFELFYQPQLSISGERIVGAEALLRWRHPERGVLAPGHFIEALEQSDYAISVGNWVIQTAARQAKTWADAGFPVRMGINMSAAHFASDDVLQLAAEVLEETQLSARLMEMEVTENIVLQSGERGRTLIAKLRAMGLNVAFDDFGTGYGSLSDLRSIPVDRIKIDRSFVKDAMSSPNDASIVRGIVSLAKSLGLAVIAEGVEEAGQEELLKRFGCDEVQGYLYGKPMPAAAFFKLMEEHAAQQAEDKAEAARAA